ncbi:S-adenosyl-L-methionine-dependent methyltransferase [Stachybotrys elegans]|uniref:S-adenosyl-L-methionine-dependent methyltransferase n=1 Tax=Stachybotrys elegans TaxID=80388 RepID=A0A8K0WKG7_9HYPO|nr:S-adenosyl-L-methionine-dependent methyltransferase [Stachybotrys elegans]
MANPDGEIDLDSLADHVIDQESETDNDSAVGVDSDAVSTTSLPKFQYATENGRTYHVHDQGKCILPNDAREMERLNDMHKIWVNTLGGEISLCRESDTRRQRVLDLGTGNGTWAIAYADAHLTAQVIGVDITPTQDTWVPPNVQFEIDDIEKEWTWKRKFDFVFGRDLMGSIRDWAALLRSIFNNLNPGGWVEIQDYGYPHPEGTEPPPTKLLEWRQEMVRASKALGKRIDMIEELEDLMMKEGFAEIRCVKKRIPLDNSSKNESLNQIGKSAADLFEAHLESISMIRFKDGLGYSIDEVIAYLSALRTELKKNHMSAYFEAHIIYGCKPVQGLVSEDPV